MSSSLTGGEYRCNLCPYYSADTLAEFGQHVRQFHGNRLIEAWRSINEEDRLITDGGTADEYRLPEFVDEARVVGGTARCRGCGYTIRFEGVESHDLAHDLWFGDEHRGRHE